MYMILYWKDDSYMTCIHNEDGSIRIFVTLEEADNYANASKCSDHLRVITIEGCD